MVEGRLQRWLVVVEGILVAISTSSWLVILHNDGLWWQFTETTFTDFLSLFASQEVGAGKPKLSSSGDPLTRLLPIRGHKRFVQIYSKSL